MPTLEKAINMPNRALHTTPSLQWRIDSFLAEILHYPAYRVVFEDDMNIGGVDEWQEVQHMAKREGAFVYAKTDVTHLSQAHALEARGFRLIDTNVVLTKPLTSSQFTPTDSLIRPATYLDEGAVAHIARTSFMWTRFHMDHSFPQGTGARVKEAWVRNYFRGKRGTFMLVAERNGKIAGFVLLDKRRGGELIVDLIAVDVPFRRQGIASQLLKTIEQTVRGFTRLVAGTQLANIPSLQLYEKSGFRITEAYYVWHYHGQRQHAEQEHLLRARTATGSRAG